MGQTVTSQDPGDDEGDENTMASDGEQKIPSPITLLLIALLGGGGSNLAGRLIAPPREDPWTGTQAREAHSRMEQQIERNRQVTAETKERVRVLEIKQEYRNRQP